MQLPTKTYMPTQRQVNCLQTSSIYQATVTRTDNNTLIRNVRSINKKRLQGKAESINHHSVTHTLETLLNSADTVWDFKDNNISHTNSWKTLARAKPYNSANKRYKLCLLEKFLMYRVTDLSTPNKLNELVSSCRHRNEALLRNN